MALKRFVLPILSLIVLQVCSISFSKASEATSDSIFYYIYNQQLSKAEKSLQLYRNSLQPDLYRLYKTDLLWWKTLSQTQVNDFSEMEMFLQQQLNRLEKDLSNSGIEELIYLNYFMRLKAIENQPFKMFGYYLRIQKLISNFDQSRLSPEEQRIYEIYTAVFNVGKSKLLMNSKLRAYSIEQLKKHQHSSQTNIQTIANYFLAKIYFDIEKSPKQAEVYYAFLCARYPHNTIFRNDLRMCQ